MAQQSTKSIKTFSIGFEEDAYNELPYARLLAQRYGTEHHELIVKPNAAEVLPLLVRHYNEPFADSSALPTYYLSKMAKQHVSVALSGDGADELFAGYDTYAAILAWKKWDVLPHSLREAAANTLNPILDKLPYNNTAARIHRALAMFGASSVRDRRLQFVITLKNEEKRILYTPFFRKLINSNTSLDDPLAAYHWEKGMDDLDWLMRHDQNFYLPDCLMVKTDIASMANGLEVRSPFLDFNLVEFASTIPSEFKRNSMGSKLILKQAIKDLLPSETLNKPNTGFATPISKWFKDELAIYIREVLLSKKSVERGLFDRRALEKMINEHTHGVSDWSNRLWAFLFLELWFREFID
jgi:asparagine synthase (glutamine-hydrolysing)